MSKKNKNLSAHQRARVQRLRNNGLSWAAIADVMGMSQDHIRSNCEPGFAAKLKERRKRENQAWTGASGRTSTYDTAMKASADAIALGLALQRARERQTMIDQILGNPPPGYSALDRKRAAEQSKSESSRVSV